MVNLFGAIHNHNDTGTVVLLPAKVGGVRSRDFARFFADAVRHHRKARELSQEELAERADLASQMISLVERSLRNPSVNVADSIAQGLGMPLWRLIKDAEDLRAHPSKRTA